MAATASTPATKMLTPSSEWKSGSSHAVIGMAHSTSRGKPAIGSDARTTCFLRWNSARRSLINASCEVAGLLGVTVIGAVLRSQQAATRRGGAAPRGAFLDRYHTGLWVTIALLAAGVVVSYVTLRPRSRQRQDLLAADTAIVAEMVPALATDARRSDDPVD